MRKYHLLVIGACVLLLAGVALPAVGAGTPIQMEVTLVDFYADCMFIVPTVDCPSSTSPLGWTAKVYNLDLDIGHGRTTIGSGTPGVPPYVTVAETGNWQAGIHSVGYSDNDDMTTVSDSPMTPRTIYTRTEFEVDASWIGNFASVEWQVDYDDEYVVWINGNLIVRSDNLVPPDFTAPLWDTVGGGHGSNEVDPPTAPRVIDSADIIDVSTAAIAALVSGTNMMAIMLINDDASSSDLTMWPQLTAMIELPFSKIPLSAFKAVGESHTFEAELATPVGTAHYEWSFDDGGGAAVVGTDSGSLTISDIQTSDAGEYWCVITDDSEGSFETPHATLGIGIATWTGTPVAGALGLGLLIGACALAGASLIRKRSVLLIVLLAVCVPAALSSAQDVVGATVTVGSGTVVDLGETPDFATDGTTIIAIYQQDDVIYVAVSDDGGATWDADDLGEATQDELEPAIATNGTGTWAAVWATNDGVNTTPGLDELMFSKSTDDGGTWTAPVAIVNNALLTNFAIYTSNGEPDVAIAGDTIIACCSTRANHLVTVTSTDGGDNWDAPVDSGAYFREPRIATDGEGVWIVAGDNDGDTAVRRSTNDGANWSEIVIIVDATVEHGECVGYADGTWILIASGDDGADVYPGQLNAYRSTNDGVTWSGTNTLLVHAPNDTNLDIASNGNGRWVVAAEHNEDEGLVLVSSNDDGLRWGTPKLLNSTSNPLNPQVFFVADAAKADGTSNFLMIYEVEGAFGNQVEVAAVKAIEKTWLGFQYFVGAPVAGVVGLGLLIGACALAGASVIRRKK